MPKKITIDTETFAKTLAMAMDNAMSAESVEQVDPDKYINKTAAILLNKFADESLENLRYSDGSLVEKSVLTDLQDLLGNFNRSAYITGQKAKTMIDAVINDSKFFDNFTIKYGDELVIPIDLKAYSKRQLTSTRRLGRQLTTGEASALASISGFEMLLQEVELQYDITMTEIRNNLYNPNFENEVLIEPMQKVLREDLLDLATNGTSDAYTTVSSDGFTALGIGHEYLLKNLNGSWTNSNGKSVVVGKFGSYHTPHKIKIDFASDYDGSDIVDMMDEMYYLLEPEYREVATYVLSQTDYDLYVDHKSNKTVTVGSTVVGINTAERDRRTDLGLAMPHRGRKVIVNPKKKSIANGGNMYLGDLKELYVGFQKMVNTTREYKARISTGGDGIENTKILMVDFQVGRRNAFVIAAPNLSVEDPVMIETVKDGSTVYYDREDNKGTAYTSSEDDQSEVSAVTVYCDTPGAKIYKHVTTAFDDGTDLPADSLPTEAGDVAEVENGDKITLTSGQYLTLRAYQVNHDGDLTLTPSSLVKIRYTEA